MLKKWLILSATALLIIAGCSKKEDVVKEEKPKQEAPEKPPVEEKEEFSYYYPFTGVGSKEEIEGRAISVMVNNHPAARPQSGIQKADIIIEMLAEGNVTRFLAIFQSEQPEKIGPVRSARDYYVELAKGYDSLFVAHGYSESARVMLEKGYVDSINGMQYDGTLFERASFRKAPHNSYIKYENILKGAEQNKFDMKEAPKALTFLTEEEAKNISGTPATQISVNYYDAIFNSKFEYDPASGKYKRINNGAETVDYDSKEPVLVDNVFVLETKHSVVSDVGHRDIDLTSGGRAFLFQKGQMLEVEWKNDEGRIVPYANGKSVGFVPGKTWINIIPTDKGLDTNVTYQ